MKPVRVPDLRVMKERGEKIAVLTAYDYTMARLLDRAGVDIILVEIRSAWLSWALIIHSR